MPEPRTGENEEEFISRCMAYPDLQRYDADQRAAICHSIWREHQHKGATPPMPEEEKSDASEYM